MIRYVIGDATRPEGGGRKLIAHVCNDAGGWGAGFVLALSNVSLRPEEEYRRWYRESRPLSMPLGQIQVVPFCGDIHVANMIAQRGAWRSDDIPLQYDALEACLEQVAGWARQNDASIHMPRIGCGLAGGTWKHVGPIVEAACGECDVTVYDLPEAPNGLTEETGNLGRHMEES